MGPDRSSISKRDACDRCHNMKSRCTKAGNSSICRRCERFGFDCNYSAPLRRGRPKKTGGNNEKPSKEQQGDSDITSVQADHDQSWPNIDLDVDLGLPSYPDPEDSSISDSSSWHSQVQWQLDMGFDTLPTAESNAGIDIRNLDFSSPSDLLFSTEGNAGLSNNFADTGEHQSTAAHARLDSETPHNNSPASIGCMSDDTHMHKLLDLQLRLLVLSRSSFGCGPDESGTSNSPQSSDMEETFFATENLVGVIHNLHQRTATPTRIDELAVYHPMNIHEDGGDKPPSESPPGLCDGATVLLILSCYLRLLHVYKVLAVSLHGNVQQQSPMSPHDASGRSSLVYSNPTSSSSSSHDFLPTSPTINVPIFNIGQFNLATSPNMNLGLLLHFILEMVERLQVAVQLCASSSSSVTENGPEGIYNLSRTTELIHRHGPDTFTTRSGVNESVKNNSNGPTSPPVVSNIFERLLSDIEDRERNLKETLYELKGLLRGRSSDRPLL